MAISLETITRSGIEAGVLSLVPGFPAFRSELSRVIGLARQFNLQEDAVDRLDEALRNDARYAEVQAQHGNAAAGMNELIDWMRHALQTANDRGLITTDEYREAMGSILSGVDWESAVPVLAGTVGVVAAAVLFFLGAPILALVAAVAGALALAAGAIAALSRRSQSSTVTRTPVMVENPITRQREPARDSSGQIIYETVEQSTQDRSGFVGDLAELMEKALPVVAVGGLIFLGVTVFGRSRK